MMIFSQISSETLESGRMNSSEVQIGEVENAKWLHKDKPVVFVVINPKSRQGASVKDEVLKTLEDRGARVLLPELHEENTDPNELILKLSDKIDLVCVAGGDGSVNHILPSLLKINKPVLVIPCGTANNLARTYDIPLRPGEAVTSSLDGELRMIDVGLINDIPFLNVAGLGLSTEVNLHVNKKLKKIFGVFAFIITALTMVLRMKPFRAVVTVDGGRPIFTRSWQISICNGKHYGSGLTIKEDASLEDSKIHLLSTEVAKWWHSLKLIHCFFLGTFKKEDQVMLISGKTIHIETRRRFWVDVDGDVKTATPVNISVLPRSLQLLVPRKTQ